MRSACLLATVLGVFACQPQGDTAVPLESARADQPLAIPPRLPENPVGFAYDELPQEVENLGGAIIGGVSFGSDGRPAADTLMAIKHVRHGPREMLWLERLLSESASEPRTTVLAVLELPVLASGEAVLYALCRVNGRPDPEIVAVGLERDEEYFRTIRRAWRASRRSERFEETSSQGIDCENEGYGADGPRPPPPG